MNKTIILFAACILSLTLGCTPRTETRIVKDVEVSTFKVPDELSEDCVMPAIPDEKIFTSLGCGDRSDFLSLYVTLFVHSIDECNSRMKRIRKWEVGKDKIIEEYNANRIREQQ